MVDAEGLHVVEDGPAHVRAAFQIEQICDSALPQARLPTAQVDATNQPTNQGTLFGSLLRKLCRENGTKKGPLKKE